MRYTLVAGGTSSIGCFSLVLAGARVGGPRRRPRRRARGTARNVPFRRELASWFGGGVYTCTRVGRHTYSPTRAMLLAMQRAVFIKAMPLRTLGATAEQAVDICNTIERRVPELGKELFE